MRQNVLAVMFLALCPLLIAQQILNNDSIIKLVKAGISDDLIVSTINGSQGAYDTSADGIIALKAAGASDRIVASMVTKAAAPALTAPAAAPAPILADPDDPASTHDAGIYIFNDKAPKGSKMTMLEPSAYGQSRMSGFGSMKIKEALRNSHANIRITDPQPVFYFYFEQTGAGLSRVSGPDSGTSTPNEYTLIKFDVKKDSRETVVASMGSFGGSGGADKKSAVDFTYTKLRPGVYKVTMKESLKSGEYGFSSTVHDNNTYLIPVPMLTAASSASNSKVFDFGED